MIRRILSPIAIPLCLALSAATFAASPLEVVKHAETAGRYVSYRGIKTASVYFAGRFTTSTLKVLHIKPDKTRTDFFTPSSIAGFIVIQDGEQVWTYSPSLDVWERRPTSPKYSPDAIHVDLIKNYELKIIGSDEVAGRTAYVIYASPHNAAEPARRIWIDSSSYLVVRTQLEDRRGTILNASRYVNIEVNPDDISNDAFRITGSVREAPKAAEVEFTPIMPKHLPAGYKLVATSSVTIDNLSCAHMQFSNGTSLISLFQRKASGIRDKSPVAVKSKTTHVLSWSRNGIVFTLIGDVSHRELSKIAASVR